MRFVIISLLLCAAVAAQEDRADLDAEVARRALLELPRDEVPVAALTAQLADADDEVVWRAASVLMHHGLAREGIAGLRDRGDLRLRELALRCADQARLLEVLRGAGEPQLRRRALFALEDGRGLTDRELVAVLADEDEALREAAAVVVLYERVPLSPDLLRQVEVAADARRALLHGLAGKPRPDAYDWLERLWKQGALDPVERLHAIAALPADQLDHKMALEVLNVAGERDPDVVDAAYAAAANLTARLADGLLAEVRWRCEQGANVADFLPYLTKISPDGDQHLLAIASSLDQRSCETICTWLVSRESTGLEERVQAALDGEIPLELHLLSRARLHLDSPARIRRVAERLVLGDDTEKARAFQVLTRAGIYVDAMLDYATEQRAFQEERVRMLAGMSGGSVPDGALLVLLQLEMPRAVAFACRIAAKAELGDMVERVIVERATGTATEEVAAAATRAVLVAGSRAAVEKVWQWGRDSSDQIRAVQWLLQRRDPWVEDMLRQARAATERGALDEFLRNALARLGDRALFDELIATAGESRGGYLRQVRSFVVPAMNAEQAAAIAAQAEDRSLPMSVRTELVSWLGQRPDLDLQDSLERLRTDDASDSLRMEALRALLVGPRREALRAELLTGIDGPLDEQQRELAFQIVATAEPPMTDADQDLLARLALQMPLLDPAEEVRLDSLGRTRGGFPMLRLIVRQLRRDPRAGAAFDAVADAVLRDPSVGLLSRNRCLVFLMQSGISPELLAEAGPAVARVLLRVPEAAGGGLAHWLLGTDAELEGDLQRAVGHYASAARAMLRDPDRRAVWAVLGDHHAVSGVHPLAALAARGPMIAARASLGSGDRGSAARQLAVAATLATGDDETAREVLRLQTELNR